MMDAVLSLVDLALEENESDGALDLFGSGDSNFCSDDSNNC
jgi:hypothetical protein